MKKDTTMDVYVAIKGCEGERVISIHKNFSNAVMACYEDLKDTKNHWLEGMFVECNELLECVPVDYEKLLKCLQGTNKSDIGYDVYLCPLEE